MEWEHPEPAASLAPKNQCEGGSSSKRMSSTMLFEHAAALAGSPRSSRRAPSRHMASTATACGPRSAWGHMPLLAVTHCRRQHEKKTLHSWPGTFLLLPGVKTILRRADNQVAYPASPAQQQ